jgi:hypothetical protein
MSAEREQESRELAGERVAYTVWRLPYRRAIERMIGLHSGPITLTVSAMPRSGAADASWTGPRLEPWTGGPIHLVDVGTVAAAAFQLFTIYAETFEVGGAKT